jgi:hypothetical protein
VPLRAAVLIVELATGVQVVASADVKAADYSRLKASQFIIPFLGN